MQFCFTQRDPFPRQLTPANKGQNMTVRCCECTCCYIQEIFCPKRWQVQGSVIEQGELREGRHGNVDCDNWWWRQWMENKPEGSAGCISSLCSALPVFWPDLIIGMVIADPGTCFPCTPCQLFLGHPVTRFLKLQPGDDSPVCLDLVLPNWL